MGRADGRPAGLPRCGLPRLSARAASMRLDSASRSDSARARASFARARQCLGLQLIEPRGIEAPDCATPPLPSNAVTAHRVPTNDLDAGAFPPDTGLERRRS